MASFRKYAHGWRAEIFKKGIRESATFATKREAQEWAGKREAEIASMRAGQIIRWTLAEVLDKYIQDVSPTKASGDKEILRLPDATPHTTAALHSEIPRRSPGWTDRCRVDAPRPGA